VAYDELIPVRAIQKQNYSNQAA